MQQDINKCLWQQQILAPLAALGLTYEKDVSALSFSADFVATGL
jgi:hypothetical protein